MQPFLIIIIALLSVYYLGEVSLSLKNKKSQKYCKYYQIQGIFETYVCANKPSVSTDINKITNGVLFG